MAMIHKLLAGADILLMPSRFEPCGLHQLHALRYGTVPVVRATGGLNDTVEDHSKTQLGTGFKFREYEVSAFLEAIQRAKRLFAEPQKWQGLMTRGMSLDFSWESAAPLYEDLYQRAIALRREEQGA